MSNNEEKDKRIAELEQQIEGAKQAGPLFAWLAVAIYAKTGRVPLGSQHENSI